MIAELLTTISVWLITWRYVSIPVQYGPFGWFVLQTVYIVGVFLIMKRIYNKEEAVEEIETDCIGFTADLSDD